MRDGNAEQQRRYERAPRLVSAALLSTVLAIGALYMTTIRDGHDWGDDFAQYISHARNLVEGRAYDATGYIYDPHAPSVGPRAYPPLYPLLLAPVYRLYGLDLMAMKREGVVVFVLALFVVGLLVKDELPAGAAVALVAAIGLNPFFWAFKDRVSSDLLFLLLTYLFLWQARDIDERYQRLPSSSRMIRGGLLGVLIYLCVATRTVGLALLPSLLACDLLRRKRLAMSSLVATGVFGLLFLVQRAWLGSGEASYVDQLVFSPSRYLRNFYLYASSFAVLFGLEYWSRLAKLLLLIVTVLAALGYLARLKKGVTILEVYFVVYMVPVLLWSAFQGTRLIIPVIPLYGFYAITGARALLQGRPNALRSVGPLAALAIVGLYAALYFKVDFGPIRDGAGSEENQRLYHFVRTATPPSAVIVSKKPRALALYTRRAASPYHRTDDAALWRYFEAIGAGYLVLHPLDDASFRAFVARNEAPLVEVYQSPSFRLYRIEWGRVSGADPALKPGI